MASPEPPTSIFGGPALAQLGQSSVSAPTNDISMEPTAGPSRPLQIDSDVFTSNPVTLTESSTTVETTINPALLASNTAQPLQPIEILNRKPAIPEGRRRIRRTGYIYDMMMMLHCNDGYTPTEDDVEDDAGGHPEEPMRIKRIFMRLKEAGLIGRMVKLDIAEVTQEQVTAVHTQELWDKVEGTTYLTDEAIAESKHYYEQLSLYVNPETAHCARLSCGGVIKACEAVCKGEVKNAFAIVRPPGHHAEPDEHMGFCFYNNVAVAAKEMQRQNLAKKVLILDWDVHHGNGTQRAFYDDPSVLYISIHRHDGGKFYPSSDFGAADVVGSGDAKGTSVNIPWPGAGHGDADYLYAFQRIVMPIAYEFAPDLVIISAGFDAADGDMLGECRVTPPAYAHMTHMLCALAGGKVVVALEGGYNLKAISDSALAVGQVLLGEPPAELPLLRASEIATEVIYQVAKIQSEFWRSVDVKACEPPEVDDTEDLKVMTSIPDLLKAHRAYHLQKNHGLYQIPLALESLQEKFKGQVACTPNVCDMRPEDVLVLFVHDFGNLRVETEGTQTTDISLTNSYLLDTSTAILDWTTKSNYQVIDVNILAALPTTLPKSKTLRDAPKRLKVEKESQQLMNYIWDNYVELSYSENVILIGHGTGCLSVMSLVNSRDVQSKVKAVIQVAGLHSVVALDAANERLKGDWLRKTSRVYLPLDHPALEDDRERRRLGSQIRVAQDATKVVDVLVKALPHIKEFVAAQLGESEAIDPTPADGAADAGGQAGSPDLSDDPVEQTVNGGAGAIAHVAMPIPIPDDDEMDLDDELAGLQEEAEQALRGQDIVMA